jgi:hypothetical protein
VARILQTFDMHTNGCTKLTVAVLTHLVALISTCSAVNDAQPIVGAIRWDAWYGEGSVPKQTEYILSQPKYHFRLPWFAKIAPHNVVHINGENRETFQQEINYAAIAGLNYWAFLDYWDESPSLGIGLDLYLHAVEKKGVHYCLIEEGGRLDKVGARAWDRLVRHFQDPNYQTVLNGRPLLYVYIKPESLAKADWEELRRQTLSAGLPSPYLVLMGWDLEQVAKQMKEIGFDAISSYARGGAYTMTQPSYAEQRELVRHRIWEKLRALNVPTVTFASAGWDTRPRNERPPSWLKELQATPDPTPPEQQKPLLDSVTASANEVASHLQDAIQWTLDNRALNPANAILVYAWNEHDEGGWLQPTLGADGIPDTSRVEAIGRVLLKPVP